MSNFEEIQELRDEWRELKERAFYALVVGILVAVGYGIWVGTIATRVDRNATDIAKADQRSTTNEARLNAIEITNSSTNARLSSIDAVLQEIKLAIKQIKN